LQILGSGETKNVVKLIAEVGKPLKMICCNTFEVEKGEVESLTESGKNNYLIKFKDGSTGTYFSQ
jgi:hypothetical protein